MAIRSLIIWHCWNYCSLFKCQTWYLSDWFILSPHFHRLLSLRNDSHIRCHVKHLTLLSQHLIFALQVDIYHCPAETEFRWFRFTSFFMLERHYNIPLTFSSSLRRDRATSCPGEFTQWRKRRPDSWGLKD